MNKTVTALTALVLVGGLAGLAAPAQASVTVTATITKHKDITVAETISITKVAIIEASVLFEAGAAAEALSLANVDNNHNLVDRVTGATEGVDATITRTATITTRSISTNHGIVGVNQDTGDNSNLGNLVSFGATQNGRTFTNAEASVDQRNQHNEVAWGPNGNIGVFVPENGDHDLLDITITGLIENSINDNVGIVGVNQNGGNMNNQTNAVAAAVGLNIANNAVALAESDLGQLNTDNFVGEFHTTKDARIEGSINGNTGIVGVNQALGNNTNQANVVSIAATLQ